VDRLGWSMRDGILYVDATAHYSSLEGWGIHLFNYMARRLRSTLIDLEMWDPSRPLRDDQVPVGPEFVYDSASAIFGGRSGHGPLFIAWDTNLLLDYFNFGSSLWQGRDLPDELGAEYTGELEGLQFLVALWVLRDIRFVILPATVTDAKRKLSQERRVSRLNAFRGFTSALQLVSDDPPELDLPSRDGLLVLPERMLERAVSEIPPGFDRALVSSAARMGLHVFLTRDKGILRHRDALRPFGLLLASPLDIFEELLACGAFHCMLEPRCAYWPMPDQMRVGHLIRALPSPAG
jgi:hypothetical protein